MKPEKTKPAVRLPYREFALKYFERDFGKLSNKQTSEALLRFYIAEIQNRLRREISSDDFDEAYVDNSGDLGTDFIQRNDGEVLIIQAKYSSPGATTGINQILHFQTLLKRLNDPDFAAKANPKLHEALSEIDFASDRFDLRFITLGRIDGQAKVQTQKEADLPKIDGIADRVSFEFLDEGSLTEEYRQALSLEGGISGDAEIVTFGQRGRRSGIISLDIGEHPSCVMVVPASQIVDLYKRNKESLFTLNVRNYIGNTATNKAIIKTATEEPADFYHLNNGISCLATKLQIREDRVEVSGLQVINGAQTVKALFKADAKHRWNNPENEPGLLMRITEASAYGEEGRFRERIIRANNTQNIIKISDFRSNDPIQNDLRSKFSSYKRFGKVVQYIPKRIDKKLQNATTIPLEAFAKSIYAFLCNPIRFSGTTSFLFDDGDAGGYRYIFGNGREVWTTMPEQDFRLRSAIWWLATNFGDRLKKDREKAENVLEAAAQERKWPVIFCARLFLERSYGGDEYVADLCKTYKGDWRFGEAPYGTWFDQIYDRARGAVIYLYTEAANRTGFVHRNWMRSESTVESFKSFILSAPVGLVKRLSDRD
jgi:hypothetical protein